MCFRKNMYARVYITLNKINIFYELKWEKRHIEIAHKCVEKL